MNDVDTGENSGEVFDQPQEERQEEINELLDLMEGDLEGDDSDSDDDADDADRIVDGEDESDDDGKESDDIEDLSDEEGEEDEAGEDEQEDEEGAEEEEAEKEELDEGGEREGEDEAEESDGEEDAEESDSEDEEDGQVELLLKQNEALMKMLQERQAPAKPAEESDEGDESGEGEGSTLDVAELIGDQDIDDIVGDKPKFVEFLQDFGSKLISATVQQTLLAIPKIVNTQVTQQTRVQEVVDDFYKENKDLMSVKPIIGITTNQVAAEHPGWTVDKILDEAATRTRKMLGLRKQAVDRGSRKDSEKSTKDSKRKTGLPKKKPGARGSKSRTDRLTKLEKEIQELDI